QPWYLREQRNWWNFRIKGEAFIALGQAGSPEAREVLEALLALPDAEAKFLWRETHWDAARALCSGAWELDEATMRSLFNHPTAAVRRTASVYLMRESRLENLRDELLEWSKPDA
ncbi:MAG: hypothetical protein AAF585_20885, partial [Verrucomicrobiota bacterium]